MTKTLEKVLIYADGSCSGNPGPMGAGVVILRGTEEKDVAVHIGSGTNQQAELRAVLQGLLALGSEQDLCQFDVSVFTDSAYVVGILTHNWDVRANIELVNALKAVSRKCGAFKIEHVPGHSGHALNERAHKLATKARQNRSSDQVNWTPADRSSHMSVSREMMEELEVRIEQLAKALRFYADPLCYTPPPGEDGKPPAIVTDRGAVARRVLQALGFMPVEEPFAGVAA